MTCAFVFPGQGSQSPGMGSTYIEAWPEARAVFQRMTNAVDFDLETLVLEDGAETLRRTRNTQPAVYAVGLAVALGATDRFGIQPDFVAGHSLGHITAAAYAGLVDPIAGLQLTRTRGLAMESAARRDGPGEMVAVLFADPETVRDACEGIPGVEPAAFNTSRQTVISGQEDAINLARSEILDDGPGRFVSLDVIAAFHSPIMATAVEPIRSVLAEAELQRADLPIVSDVTTAVYRSPTRARQELVQQIRCSVDWVGVLSTLEKQGVDLYVELPPAGTLTEFIEEETLESDVITIEAAVDGMDADRADRGSTLA